MAKKSISEKKELNIRITFTEPLLGTISGDKDITEEFIASKHPQGVQEEELESIQELSEIVQKQSTYFARDKDKNPMLWDYQVKGFLKDACGMMLRITKVPELRAYKKIVDGLMTAVAINYTARETHLSLTLLTNTPVPITHVSWS